jgi:UDP-perosamine 4-acetyltransferase
VEETVEQVVLLGAGAQARVVLDILRAIAAAPHVRTHPALPEMQVLGLLNAYADAAPTDGIEGLPILAAVPATATAAIPAIGENRLREALSTRFATRGRRLVSVAHPSAVISARATLGAGIVVCPGAVIVTGGAVADGVIVNTGATVDHDCQLGAFCHIAPGAHLAGRVIVGERALIGISACVRQGITIGEDAVVGAGAAVVDDVPPGATVVGVPARLLRA